MKDNKHYLRHIQNNKRTKEIIVPVKNFQIACLGPQEISGKDYKYHKPGDEPETDINYPFKSQMLSAGKQNFDALKSIKVYDQHHY